MPSVKCATRPIPAAYIGTGKDFEFAAKIRKNGNSTNSQAGICVTCGGQAAFVMQFRQGTNYTQMQYCRAQPGWDDGHYNQGDAMEWVKIKVNNNTLYFYFSGDGENWVTFDAQGSYIGGNPDGYGFAIGAYDQNKAGQGLSCTYFWSSEFPPPATSPLA